MERVVVISAAPLVLKNENFHLYSPYEKEMKLWEKHSETIQFCCPVWEVDRNLLIEPISFPMEEPVVLKEFDSTSFLNALKAIPLVFVNSYRIYKIMQQADHIHLRCPGNMGLLATVVQICFPKKKKTAKYAGNWDPKAKQPFTYKVQRWLLSNTFLTKNMQVLVYGEWPKQTSNIRPFFTATYSAKEIQTAASTLPNELSLQEESRSATNAFDSAPSDKRVVASQLSLQEEARSAANAFDSAQSDKIVIDSQLSLQEESRSAANAFDSAPSDKRVVASQLTLRAESRSRQNYKFIFVGTLSKGKQPLYAIQLVAQLHQNGIKATLDLYGEGVLRIALETYINRHNLQEYISLKGNQTKETLKNAYQTSHFLILPSKSEGWPKAVAEAMFWGCVPVATPVSCVSYMLNAGSRGLLLTENMGKDVAALIKLVAQPDDYKRKSKAAQEWSQHYTIELFEEEIQKLLAD
ncbi:glycosyltransferase [Flavobacterium psychraquaticum]|uniref:glycosyltransferase family 4 protein n=1 Tax=Flavobacterium psychraquaticum TaxID=3103958 RepID=UPI002ACD30D0|nr:glycosyltransferase [Flavobacterium sp. LB-N7T]